MVAPMTNRFLSLPLTLMAAFALLSTGAGAVELFDGNVVAPIVHQEGRTAALAAGLLARDIRSLTGRETSLSSDLARCGTVCIVIGDKDSPLVAAVARETGTDLSALDGQWERYRRAVLHGRGRTYLLIAGSDPRGMVWGVVDLSREMGVSAWEWWADVAPRKVSRLSVAEDDLLSKEPSVRYRGIFLNDEDWGLEPWAAKTYDPKTGNIGPRTYARIFELMWRLKANTLWPAMHSTICANGTRRRAVRSTFSPTAAPWPITGGSAWKRAGEWTDYTPSACAVSMTARWRGPTRPKRAGTCCATRSLCSATYWPKHWAAPPKPSRRR
jgi:hypothetical protein